ncbi:alpha-galactosidase [Selaginella moellendorffii]|uniref:alpha-galactosidase n=1 Tax=Selaginella moellendorffii TaxID=88036 RepID=UPI000D1C3223|nr:alpha-galactosidase [Selaginella moellendorffii]|eukprot:XP_024524653.1 alpha-galactosidase [Selaginella moellendorffii]
MAWLLAIFSLAIATRLLPASTAGLALTPPRGWNSYDSFSWIVSEEEFLQNAKILANTLAPFGYEYVVIDFLWYRKQEEGASVQSSGHDLIDEWGRPVPDPKRWPSTAGGKGFAPIADKVHAMGLKFGIHVMRGITTVAVANNTPILGAKGWRAKDIALTSQPCPWMRECFVSINTTSAGGKAFLKSLYDQYASWGVDFVKHDCVFGADNIDLEEIQAVSEAITNTGRPIVYSLSPGVQATPSLASSVSGIVNMYRITGDDWDRWGDVAAHFDVAKSFAAAGLIGAPGLGGGKSWPDLDMLPLGWLTDGGAPYGPYRSCRLSFDEQKTQLTLWAMAKSPLMYGGDLRNIDQATYAMITNPTILEINTHSTENTEYYAGTLPGTEDVPLLTLVSCDESSSKTHWTLEKKQNARICWNASRTTSSRSSVLSGCFNWTSLSDSSLSDTESKGAIRLWTSDFGELCMDSQPNLPSSIGMFASKRFSFCSMENSQAWQLLPNGKLLSPSTGFCAEVKEVAPIRIWLARGLKGQYYVAFFNLGQNSTTVTYSLAGLQQRQPGLKLATTRARGAQDPEAPKTQPGLDADDSSTQCTGEEVWSRTELDKVESLSALVPSHGCALFSLICSASGGKNLA